MGDERPSFATALKFGHICLHFSLTSFEKALRSLKKYWYIITNFVFAKRPKVSGEMCGSRIKWTSTLWHKIRCILSAQCNIEHWNNLSSSVHVCWRMNEKHLFVFLIGTLSIYDIYSYPKIGLNHWIGDFPRMTHGLTRSSKRYCWDR